MLLCRLLLRQMMMVLTGYVPHLPRCLLLLVQLYRFKSANEANEREREGYAAKQQQLEEQIRQVGSCLRRYCSELSRNGSCPANNQPKNGWQSGAGQDCRVQEYGEALSKGSRRRLREGWERWEGKGNMR